MNWRVLFRTLLKIFGAAFIAFVVYRILIISPKSISSNPISSEPRRTRRRGGNRIPKKIVCETRNILIGLGEGKDIQPIDEAINALNSFMLEYQSCDLYLVTHCTEDDTEFHVVDLFKNRLLNINENKILFYSTDGGGSHMSRHIEPDLYIHHSADILRPVSVFLPNVALISTKEACDENSEIPVYPSLRSFLSKYIQ